MSKMSDLDLKIKSNPTLRRGLNAMADAKYPLATALSNPNAVLALPGVSVKVLYELKQHALDIGYTHPLVAAVQRLLKDEWEAGANNQPGWHHEPNQVMQLTRRLEDWL